MGSLLIVTGPPGAGKSTVAKLLAASMPRSVLVQGDAFFGFLANGAIDPWLPESHEQNTVVTKAAGKATGEFVVGGFSVVYDGVIGPWFLDTFVTTADLTEVDYAVLLPTVEACQQRVEARRGHGFTDLAATASMHRQFPEAELEQRYLIREQGLSPGESADLIREALSSGTLRHSITLAVHNALRYASERAAVVP
jgi:cytidylate kinase